VQRKQRRMARGKVTWVYYLRTILVVGSSLFLIWGCEGGSQTPRVTVAKRQQSHRTPPKKNEEKVVDEKKEDPYTYNPVGKRDPFKPFIALGPKKPVSKAPLTPLQRYDVSELKLVGILKGPRGYRALVEDAGGKGFIIGKGTLIGRENGKVKEIHEDRVIVEQRYKDIFGQMKHREITIPLRKPGEGGAK